MTQKKKIISLFALICMFPLTGCGQNKISSDLTTDNVISEVYSVYQEAQEAGFSGTYEEWIDSIRGATGDTGATGEKGNAGRSVVSIVKTSSSDNVDTYTITFSDGTTSVFQLTNGTDGKNEFEKEEAGSTYGLAFYPQDDGTYYVGGGTTADLENVIVPTTHNGQKVTGIQDYGFIKYENLKTITLPDCLEYIGEEAFRGSGLTSLEIPDNVKDIETNAFEDCDSLTYVTLPESLEYLGSYVFQGSGKLKPTAEKDGISYFGSKTNPYFCAYRCDELTVSDLVFPDETKICAKRLLEDQTILTSVKLPDPMVNLSSEVFLQCTNLTLVTFGSHLENIGRDAFYKTGLTSVVIPDTVTSVSMAAFMGCEDLTSITFSENMTSIDMSVCEGCTSLVSVHLPDGIQAIDDAAFRKCSSLSSFSMGSKVAYIGESVFESCTALTNLDYSGTMDQFNAIDKDEDWNTDSVLTTVTCSDGSVSL